MAAISDLIAERFANRVPTTTLDASCVIVQLDMGLFHAGKMVESVFDMVVHPTTAVDEDAVAAALLSLLAYIGQLGGAVDALEGFVSDGARVA